MQKCQGFPDIFSWRIGMDFSEKLKALTEWKANYDQIRMLNSRIEDIFGNKEECAFNQILTTLWESYTDAQAKLVCETDVEETELHLFYLYADMGNSTAMWFKTEGGEKRVVRTLSDVLDMIDQRNNRTVQWKMYHEDGNWIFKL